MTSCTWLPMIQLRGSAKSLPVSSVAFDWLNRPDQKPVLMHAEQCHNISEWGKTWGYEFWPTRVEDASDCVGGPICIIPTNKRKHSWETLIAHEVKSHSSDHLWLGTLWCMPLFMVRLHYFLSLLYLIMSLLWHPLKMLRPGWVAFLTQ